eukprot:CAMPEP_0179411990 /NCGR_PEP_ID=MMETSP0799-20121207/4207_1 /TAXON_ID=46947 /ORGANISM="Geminigera cryophila, Strain CCMP2564" /LENGTH=230 /DNA_ID=CAMNT_0021184127 /DNA_START=3 /DNA_END=692 /DNA_ORIENTATION=-
MGEHAGNRFAIVLRHVTASEAHVRAAVERLQNNGFINYYGHQRFGSGALPSIKVGAHLHRASSNESAWEAAAVEALSDEHCRAACSEGERMARRVFSRGYSNGDLSTAAVESRNESLIRALRYLPMHGCDDEHILLNALLRKQKQEQENTQASAGCNTLRQAFESIPRCKIWKQAFSSYIWNHAASFRLRHFSRTHAVEGDFVLQEREGEREQNPDIKRPFQSQVTAGDA